VTETAATADGEAATNAEELISQGETIYAEECASCHQLNGEGTSEYPALNGSEMLTAEDPTEAITIVLQGRGEMPAFDEILSAEEIAAVLSHERNAWDNSASVVTAEQVQEVSGN
jgi:cytochrome c oxidase subunit 2